MCVRVINGGNNTMNKKLIALLAVATMGISVVGATPQTQFTKGETQVDLGAASVETKADGFKAAHKWNFDGNITHALRDKTASQVVVSFVPIPALPYTSTLEPKAALPMIPT